MRGPAPGDETMKTVASGSRLTLAHLLIGVLLPAGALAAQARSSMAVSVEVVRGSDSTAAAALIETIESRGPAIPAVKGETACTALGSSVIVDGVWAACSWDPASRLYLVTVQY